MSNHPNQSPTYRIKTVGNMTGLSPHLIRKWEERYQLIHPQRGPNGYRIFTEDDIQFLLYLKTQLTQGETIGQLTQMGETHLRQAMKGISCNLSSISNDYQSDVRHFIQCSLNQQYDGMQRIVAHWILSLGLEKAVESILFPLLRLIGELWHEGGISHSAELSVSRIIRQQLIQQLRKAVPGSKDHALIACVPGDYHEIGPLTATLLLQKRGWQATYLGPNISLEVLETALRRRQPRLILLSSTTDPEIRTGQSWLKILADQFLPYCPIIAGGAGFGSLSEDLAKWGIPYLKHMKEVSLLDPKSGAPSQMEVV